jgi:dihydrofolate reductase
MRFLFPLHLRGEWQIPLSDEEVGAFLNDVYARADAFLFGRRTYEIFAGSWGLMKDPSQSPIGQALHSRRKYVASSTLTEPRWAGQPSSPGSSQRSAS